MQTNVYSSKDLEGQGTFLDVGDNWFINDDDRFSTRYFLFHRCNGYNLVSFNYSMTNPQFSPCGSCKAEAPDYVKGFFRLCKSNI